MCESMSMMMRRLFVKMPQEDRTELLQGYKEAFPDEEEGMLLQAMIDNAADSQEVECMHFEWILSHLPQDEFPVERRRFQEYELATRNE